MKRFLRLVPVCLIPGLMFVFFNAALAGSPDAKSYPDEYSGQIMLNPGGGRVLAGQGFALIDPITGLAITHTIPAFAKLPTYFTATITGGELPVVYRWSFGDDQSSPTRSDAVVSHIYALAGTYTVVVTAFNGGLASQTTLVTVVDPPYQTQLPLILKEFTPPIQPSDLTCRLSIDPPAPSPGQTFLITVQIENLKGGNADGFWVDLYINPTIVPTKGHLLPWQEACGSLPCSHGIAWSISDTPLAPGITRTLVSIPHNFHPDGFNPSYSAWTGSLPAGTYNLYAYADSIENPSPDDKEGAVLETEENNNRCEKLGLIIPPVNLTGAGQGSSNSLPTRPTP